MQLRCEEAYKQLAESQQSGFENKEGLKKASNIFFEILREEPCIQAYVGLAYLFLLLNQKQNAILYLAPAHEMNPHDDDVNKLLEYILKEDPDLNQHIYTPTFKDDKEDFYNYQDDIPIMGNINILEEVPSEILVLIFSWLKPASVAKFRQVCKYYRDLLVNNVYWQEECAERWTLTEPEHFKRIFKGISNDQFYYQYYRSKHNTHVNWLNRATKFEEIKKLKGGAVGLYSLCPDTGIYTLHLDQKINGQNKRSVEFFRIKNRKMHRIKRLLVDIDVTYPSTFRSVSTSTADHVITYANNGTLVVSDINKRESKVHQANGYIEAISGLPTTNGIKFLAGADQRVSYYDGSEVTKTVQVAEVDENFQVRSMSTQPDGMAAIASTSMTGLQNSVVKILNVETCSVVDSFAIGRHRQIEWVWDMPDVLVGYDQSMTFYDIRTKNKFVVPTPSPSSNINFTSVAIDQDKVFALSDNALTLFDCRYSSSIVDRVPLPQHHTAVPGLALWGMQNLVYATKQGQLVEWNLGQVITPVKL